MNDKFFFFSFFFFFQIIPGCNGTSVESLDWCKGRLFTAGLHAELTEWNLNSLCPKVFEHLDEKIVTKSKSGLERYNLTCLHEDHLFLAKSLYNI